MKYTVITDNGGGPNLIYHNIAGEVYTFPTRYKDLYQTLRKIYQTTTYY